jgi:hypothetical protein
MNQPAVQTTSEDAKNRQLMLPPAMLEAIREDPEVLVGLSRVQLAMVNDRMVKKLMSTPDPSHSQFTAVSEQLRKTATMTGASVDAKGTGFSVNIVINQTPTPARVVSCGTVIEHEDDE